MTKFIPIEGFSDYAINDKGEVFSIRMERLITPQTNRTGVVNVVLRQEGKQYCRSVAVLVARHFLTPDPREDMNTLIHLDGDRSNVAANNLAWRPRSFAVRYHKQFVTPPLGRLNRPLQIEETGEVFPNSFELAKAYGLLEGGVILTALNNQAGDRSWTTFPYSFHIYYAKS